MNLSYNDIFLKILAILNYQDRENFVKGMEQRNHMEAVTNCIETLPKTVRAKIISNPKKPEIMQEYISQEAYGEELYKASTKALAAFLQHLTPVLSDDQKKQIAAVFPN